jgi:hypothetical protein
VISNQAFPKNSEEKYKNKTFFKKWQKKPNWYRWRRRRGSPTPTPTPPPAGELASGPHRRSSLQTAELVAKPRLSGARRGSSPGRPWEAGQAAIWIQTTRTLSLSHLLVFLSSSIFQI